MSRAHCTVCSGSGWLSKTPPAMCWSCKGIGDCPPQHPPGTICHACCNGAPLTSEHRLRDLLTRAVAGAADAEAALAADALLVKATSPAPAEIPADWYPDPENPDMIRYWDGTAWTQNTMPTAGS